MSRIPGTPRQYRVKFEIDVWTADSAASACKEAWLRLTNPDAWLPVGEVKEKGCEPKLVDLQELKENGVYDKI